jgi:hypothetical protein
MKPDHGLRRFVLARAGAGLIACTVLCLAAIVTVRPATAACACGKPWPHLFCAHGCAGGYIPGPGDISNGEFGGTWYWMRSPEQERRVVMSLFNRYCIRCHGVDGRGVWDIPDVPDFTNPVWQATRPDPYRTRVILEGRGAVMPPFRGTLTLEEACAMARYLHTFVPGTEVSRPVLAPAPAPAGTAPTGSRPVTPTLSRPAPTPTPPVGNTLGPFTR